MTDEEGLKYAVQHVCLNCSELGKCDKCVHCEFLKIVRECYDDAIEIDRKGKWHDLRKNPNDLPTKNNEYYCYMYSQGYEIHRFNISQNCFLGVFSSVIAWCELPKFKE